MRKPGDEDARVSLTCTPAQADAIVEALDLYARLAIGQFEGVAYMVGKGEIPLYAKVNDPRQVADIDTCHIVSGLAMQMKAQLGYPHNTSHGIGHPHTSKTAHRAWEIKKILSKALAEHRNPNPEFRGVDLDGLVIRYTTDPAPVATIEERP